MLIGQMKAGICYHCWYVQLHWSRTNWNSKPSMEKAITGPPGDTLSPDKACVGDYLNSGYDLSKNFRRDNRIATGTIPGGLGCQRGSITR